MSASGPRHYSIGLRGILAITQRLGREESLQTLRTVSVVKHIHHAVQERLQESGPAPEIEISETRESEISLRTCMFCKKALTRKRDLASHNERHVCSEASEHKHHSHCGCKREHICPLCKKDFRFPSSLARHLSTHACPKDPGRFCRRRFSTQFNVRRHNANHSCRQRSGTCVY